MIPSGLLDRVFREDLLDPLERLVDGRFRRHPLFDDIELGDAEEMLGVDLRDGRVEHLVDRQRRTE